MSQTLSIRYRFSTVFLLVLAVVIVLGAFSIWRLTSYYIYSAEIDERFFRSTQFIGDLNNFTSDFRAAEATALVSRNASETAANANALQELDRRISLSRHSYEYIYHDRDEAALYSDFRTKWATYRDVADRVLVLSSSGHNNDAIDLYLTKSRLTYTAASDALSALTDLNVEKAHFATTHANLAYQEARALTIMAVVLAGLFVIGGLYYMRRSIANPLLDLARCMRQLARNETGVDIPGVALKDEIGEMARAVVVFRESIIAVAINQKVLADQATLLSEKLQAEQHLTQLQRNFVSMASHEFRTPLTIIDGHAQRLINAKNRFSPDDIAERATKIRNTVLRITGVIDNLINSSRLMEGNANLYVHPTEIDLRLLLNEVCRLHREVVPKADIVQNLGTRPLLTVGDRKLLFQAFSNLLSNAIKYSPDNDSIKLGASAESGQIKIVVEDHGVGIPKRDIGHLFEPYFRGSNVSRIVGTGVGLYLVKTVVDLHAGSIVVKSEEGKGSTFTVLLADSSSLRSETVRPAVRQSETMGNDP